MRFTLNGVERTYEGNPGISLLDYLMSIEDESIPDILCSGTGRCGACTMHLNGRPVLACAISMEKVESGEVITADEFGQAVQRAFALSLTRNGTTECGFCLPETAVRISAYLRKKPSPNFHEALRALDHHLCRCIGRNRVARIIVEISQSLENTEAADEA